LTVVAVSSDVARELTAVFKVPEERIRVIPNGRTAELFHPRSSASDARPVIGFVGHLTESKRPDLFLRVLEHVAETVPCRGVVIGDGPMAGAVAAMADHLPVDLLGPRADVPELLREMDVFVLTSQPEGEGMPGVLIEAALTGLAIVTTDVPGARDVVLQGVTGMIVPADDETALTDSVLGLLGDEERRNELGAAGRERAVRHLSIGSCVDAWGSLLAGMGAGGGR
jgi:glycosyltransferase involved in cell wall biosynthesis